MLNTNVTLFFLPSLVRLFLKKSLRILKQIISGKGGFVLMVTSLVILMVTILFISLCYDPLCVCLHEK